MKKTQMKRVYDSEDELEYCPTKKIKYLSNKETFSDSKHSDEEKEHNSDGSTSDVSENNELDIDDERSKDSNTRITNRKEDVRKLEKFSEPSEDCDDIKDQTFEARSDGFQDNNLYKESDEEIGSEEEDFEDAEYSEEEECDEDNADPIIFDKKQNEVLEYIKKILTNINFRKTNPKIILLQGPAGTGKTEILKTLIDECDNEGICTASTGVAALNYKTGRTAHSMFGFPFYAIDPNSLCKINDYLDQVSEAPFLIYDAVNMTDFRLIEMLNKSLQQLMLTDEAFGGKIMIFCADFFELTPIVSGAQDPNSFSLKCSTFFTKYNIKIFTLRKSYRNKRDEGYYDFIKNLGLGKLPGQKCILEPNTTDIPLNIFEFTNKISDLIDFVYPAEVLENSDLCAKRAILVPTMSQANEINEIVTKIIEKNTKKCKSINVISKYELLDEYIEQMDSLQKDRVFSGSELKLWEGCLCMVTENIYQPENTLLNGSKVIVENIQSDVILVRKPGCKEKISIVNKLRGCMMEEEFRRQFPLRLCYASTIHKSQGQTFEKVGVDLRQPVFCHGQLYLALSRVRYSKDLMICVNNDQVIKGVPYAANVVDRRLIEE